MASRSRMSSPSAARRMATTMTPNTASRVSTERCCREPGRERCSELEPIEIWWAAKHVAEQDRFDQLGMEVDRADEAEGRFAEPGDADSGNPEQYYLPPQLGWIERRIEDI